MNADCELFDYVVTLCFFFSTSYNFGPELGSAFALFITSTGTHHGYEMTVVLSMEPVNFAGRFSMKDLTPSVLSLYTS